MHTHDQTLIARLGFADPDKKDPRHDLACRYLGSPEMAHQVVSSVPCFPEGCVDLEFEVGSVAFERAIMKGEGQYRSHIGFIDLAISLTWSARAKCPGRHCCDSWGGPHSLHRIGTKSGVGHAFTQINVEVKIKPVAASEIARQINLYRQFTGGPWLVVTAFRLRPGELQVIRSCPAHHAMLGPGFDQFVAESDRAAPVNGLLF